MSVTATAPVSNANTRAPTGSPPPTKKQLHDFFSQIVEGKKVGNPKSIPVNKLKGDMAKKVKSEFAKEDIVKLVTFAFRGNKYVGVYQESRSGWAAVISDMKGKILAEDCGQND